MTIPCCSETLLHRAGRAWIAQLLVALKRSTSDLHKVFCVDLPQYEKIFARAVDACGFQRMRLTPHCCRHGGASADFARQLRTLVEVQRRGRWRAASSVRRYEKAGRLTRQVALIPQKLLQRANAIAARLPVGLAVQPTAAKRPRLSPVVSTGTGTGAKVRPIVPL